VLGLHLLGVFRFSALMRERRVHLADKPEGKLGTLAVGAAFGAGWTPCIGPILGAILTMAGASDTMWAGVGLLSVYSLGLAVPFLIAALALQWFLGTYKRFRRFVPLMEKASGALLVVLGILLVTDAFTILSGYLVNLTPDFILERI
jgi:cytochrome c-type biogenesis protein